MSRPNKVGTQAAQKCRKYDRAGMGRDLPEDGEKVEESGENYSVCYWNGFRDGGDSLGRLRLSHKV